MLLSLIIALAAVSPAPLALPAPRVPQDAAAFDSGLALVRKQMERRQWEKAYKDLRALLDKNPSAAWALAEADSIREDMRRIAFWRTHDEPDPASLVAGQLKKYKDGKLEVVFGGRDMREWEVNDGYYVFPGVFDGPYSLTLTLRSHPSREPVYFVAGADQDPSVRVGCGLKNPLGEADQYYPARMTLLPDDGKEETMDENTNVAVMSSKAATLKLDVTPTKIAYSHDGKKVLEAKRPKTDYGRVAFFNLPPEELVTAEITLAGEVQPSWMQNKMDAAVQGARSAFEKTYVEADHLPAWLISAAASPTGGPAGADGRPLAPASQAPPYPGTALEEDERAAYRAAVKELSDFEDEEFELQEEVLDRIEEEGVIAPIRLAFLRMRVADRAGRSEEALTLAARVLDEDAKHLATLLTRARALRRLERHAEAEAAFDAAIAAHPAEAEAAEDFVWYLLDRARIGKANEVVQALTAANPEARERMSWLRKILAAADKGPAFERTFEYVSDHYVVRSDLSREICFEAAQMLERAYGSYSIHLKRVSGLENTRFRVYVFSGEASYHRYTDEAFGRSRENTAGVYSGLVKQLLIWNLPDRDDRHRTTIHEGFHQYLDAVTDEAPVWFNEGLAEYYERAETVDGRFQTGQVALDHVRLLRETAPAPLAEFLRIRPGEFYVKETVSRNYAQGWALIHFLRHSTRSNQAIFDTLFQSLTTGASAAAAVHEAFASTDLDALDAAFRAHLDALVK